MILTMTRSIEVQPGAVRIGLPVQAAFGQRDARTRLPVCRPRVQA